MGPALARASGHGIESEDSQNSYKFMDSLGEGGLLERPDEIVLPSPPGELLVAPGEKRSWMGSRAGVASDP